VASFLQSRYRTLVRCYESRALPHDRFNRFMAKPLKRLKENLLIHATWLKPGANEMDYSKKARKCLP